MDLLVWPFRICPIGNSDGGLTDAAMIQCPEAQLSVYFLHKSTRAAGMIYTPSEQLPTEWPKYIKFTT